MLLPFGQNALSAYVTHIFVVGMADVLHPVVFPTSEMAVTVALYQLAGIMIVWLSIRLRPLAASSLERLESAWSLVPVPAGSIALATGESLSIDVQLAQAQARQGMESVREGEKGFNKAEVMIPVGCDVHPWMRAYISVFDNPFYTVSKEDGTFEIKGLPAGEYEIEAFHGKLKNQSQKVTVKDGEAAKLDLAVKG